MKKALLLSSTSPFSQCADSQDTRSENSSQDVAGWIGQEQEWRRLGTVNRIGYKGKRSPSADSGGQMETQEETRLQSWDYGV